MSKFMEKPVAKRTYLMFVFFILGMSLLLIGIPEVCEEPVPVSIVKGIDFEKATDSTVSLINYRTDGMKAAGAGVVLEGNIVLTAAHVIRDSAIVHAETKQGGQYIVDYMYVNEELDLAILEFREDLKAGSSKVSSTDSKVGDVVYICGFSHGAYPQNLSRGIVSSMGVVWDQLPGVSFYGTDALLVKGNSGGPWYNEAGEVVSISSWAVGYSGNVGFGVPRDVIEKFVQVYWILR